MQVLASRGFEGGEQPGLGWIAGEVVLMRPSDPALRIPQTGWNDVRYRSDSPLFQGLPGRPDFYFVHSFAFRCEEGNNVDATCDYGGEITAAVRKENIFATQFHPEKSQDFGLKVLENFLKWKL